MRSRWSRSIASTGSTAYRCLRGGRRGQVEKQERTTTTPIQDQGGTYLTSRSQRIKLGNCLSSRSDLSFGVPQGSVLGPLIFNSIPFYSVAWSLRMLSLIISMLAIASCIFPFHQAKSAAALNDLQSCLASVQSWKKSKQTRLFSTFLLRWLTQD